MSGGMTTVEVDQRLQRSGLAWKLSRPMLVLSVAYAALQGARLPSLWVVTLYTPSLTGGFVKRSLVGTLLRPLFVIKESYWFGAVTALVALLAVLVIVVSAAWRSQLLSQRYLVVGFLVISTGGFLFHEVGYLEQFVYLAFFAAAACLAANRVGPAAALIALTPLIHELSILTVLPLFAFVALQRLEPRRAAIAVAPAVAVAAVTMVIPPVAQPTIHRLAVELGRSGFVYRRDALALFGRSQSDAWSRYSIPEVVGHVGRYGVIACAAIVAVMLLTPRLSGGEVRRRWLVLVAGIAAVGAPTLLAYGGYDYNRWSFLTIVNLALVTWFWIGAGRRELSAIPALALAVVGLFTLAIGLPYFDGYHPRSMSPAGVESFIDEFRDGGTFSDLPPCDIDVHRISNCRG
jgi:hypothetical protein